MSFARHSMIRYWTLWNSKVSLLRLCKALSSTVAFRQVMSTGLRGAWNFRAPYICCYVAYCLVLDGLGRPAFLGAISLEQCCVLLGYAQRIGVACGRVKDALKSGRQIFALSCPLKWRGAKSPAALLGEGQSDFQTNKSGCHIF